MPNTNMQKIALSQVYRDAVSKLNTLQKRSPIDRQPRLTSCQRTRAWLDYLKLNISNIDFIHVAGTKGKGTTCLYTEDIIMAALKTEGRRGKIGCLTSPHLISVRERIRINAEEIMQNSFATHFWHLWGQMHAAPASAPPLPGYPSFITLLAFSIFVREKVDVAILETGLGGETDSTNAISHPIVTGITEIGIDHVKQLGSSAREIAWHKAGIFKPGAPAFTVPQREDVLIALRNRAEEKGVSLQTVDDSLLSQNDVTVSPNAPFQRNNASLAFALAGVYLGRSGPRKHFQPEIVRCVQNTCLPAKFELVSLEKALWVISAAHNEMSVRAACVEFADLVEKRKNCKAYLLFSHNTDRDAKELLKLIFDIVCLRGKRPFYASFFCSEKVDDLASENPDFCNFRVSNGFDNAKRLASIWQKKGNNNVTALPNVSQVVDRVQVSDDESIVFVVGSAYLAGIARYILSRDQL